MSLSRCATCATNNTCGSPSAKDYRTKQAELVAEQVFYPPTIPAFATQAQTATAFNPGGMAHDERPLTEVLRG